MSVLRCLERAILNLRRGLPARFADSEGSPLGPRVGRAAGALPIALQEEVK